MPETQTDFGGDAFPEAYTENRHGDDCDCGECPLRTESTPGMSLRDYFAAKAMQGMLSCQDFMNEVCKDLGSKKEARATVALYAYAQADAMIAEKRMTE